MILLWILQTRETKFNITWSETEVNGIVKNMYIFIYDPTLHTELNAIET